MRSLLFLSALLLALLSAQPALAGAGLYGPRDAVVELTAANFQTEVIKSKDVWLVEFYGQEEGMGTGVRGTVFRVHPSALTRCLSSVLLASVVCSPLVRSLQIVGA
jgi:hypothetical protein